LQTFSNAIFHTVVQQLTRFQLAPHIPSRGLSFSSYVPMEFKMEHQVHKLEIDIYSMMVMSLFKKVCESLVITSTNSRLVN